MDVYPRKRRKISFPQHTTLVVCDQAYRATRLNYGVAATDRARTNPTSQMPTFFSFWDASDSIISRVSCARFLLFLLLGRRSICSRRGLLLIFSVPLLLFLLLGFRGGHFCWACLVRDLCRHLLHHRDIFSGGLSSVVKFQPLFHLCPSQKNGGKQDTLDPSRG